MATIDGIRRLVGKFAAIAGSADSDDISADERDQLQRALEQVWHAHAVYLAPRYGAVAAEPGYISRGEVLAPVHLVEDLPAPTSSQSWSRSAARCASLPGAHCACPGVPRC